MNHRIISLILAIACIILGINYYRMDRFAKSVGKSRVCAETIQLDKIKMEMDSLKTELDELTRRNKVLSAENKRLKQPKVEQPVEITVNEEASDRYNDLLSKRYKK